ncbi:MAG: hypothetical protein AAF063_30845 [Cyanobacteria bacterium J06643_5]
MGIAHGGVEGATFIYGKSKGSLIIRCQIKLIKVVANTENWLDEKNTAQQWI